MNKVNSKGEIFDVPNPELKGPLTNGESTVINTYDYDHLMFEDPFTYKLFTTCAILEEIPHEKNIHLIYPKTYNAYTKGNTRFSFEDFAKNQAKWFKKRSVLQYAKKKQLLRIIEFGPGSNPVFESSTQEIELTLVDFAFSENACGNTTNLIQGEATKIIKQLTANEERFDVIIANQLIEHLPEPTKFLLDAYEILVQGGILFIETPNLNGWERKIVIDGKWGGFHAPRHFFLFADESLKSSLTAAGFARINQMSILNPYILNNTVRNCCGNGKVSNFLRLRFLSLKNPFWLGILILADLIMKGAGLKTGNTRVIAEKA